MRGTLRNIEAGASLRRLRFPSPQPSPASRRGGAPSLLPLAGPLQKASGVAVDWRDRKTVRSKGPCRAGLAAGADLAVRARRRSLGGPFFRRISLVNGARRAPARPASPLTRLIRRNFRNQEIDGRMHRGGRSPRSRSRLLLFTGLLQRSRLREKVSAEGRRMRGTS
jgi:hypothetical protein